MKLDLFLHLSYFLEVISYSLLLDLSEDSATGLLLKWCHLFRLKANLLCFHTLYHQEHFPGYLALASSSCPSQHLVS